MATEVRRGNGTIATIAAVVIECTASDVQSAIAEMNATTTTAAAASTTASSRISVTALTALHSDDTFVENVGGRQEDHSTTSTAAATNLPSTASTATTPRTTR